MLNQIEKSVSFAEYKSARLSGKWGAQATQEQVLMSMFREMGIRMSGTGSGIYPTPPVEIIIDTIGSRFVVVQTQLMEG